MSLIFCASSWFSHLYWSTSFTSVYSWRSKRMFFVCSIAPIGSYCSSRTCSVSCDASIDMCFASLWDLARSDCSCSFSLRSYLYIGSISRLPKLSSHCVRLGEEQMSVSVETDYVIWLRHFCFFIGVKYYNAHINISKVPLSQNKAYPNKGFGELIVVCLHLCINNICAPTAEKVTFISI